MKDTNINTWRSDICREIGKLLCTYAGAGTGVESVQYTPVCGREFVKIRFTGIGDTVLDVTGAGEIDMLRTIVRAVCEEDRP